MKQQKNVYATMMVSIIKDASVFPYNGFIGVCLVLDDDKTSNAWADWRCLSSVDGNARSQKDGISTRCRLPRLFLCSNVA